MRHATDQAIGEVDLRHEQVLHDLLGRRVIGDRQEEEDEEHHHPGGRHDAPQALDVVAGHAPPVAELHVLAAPQQEAGEGEEHRHEEIRARHDLVDQRAGVRAGLESHVGDDDPRARDRAEPLQGGQEGGLGVGRRRR